jgi:hypothetical protein
MTAYKAMSPCWRTKQRMNCSESNMERTFYFAILIFEGNGTKLGVHQSIASRNFLLFTKLTRKSCAAAIKFKFLQVQVIY